MSHCPSIYLNLYTPYFRYFKLVWTFSDKTMMNTTTHYETTDKPFKDELVWQKLGIYFNSSRLKEILSHVGEIIATVDGDASMNELIVLEDWMMSLFIVNRVIKEFT